MNTLRTLSSVFAAVGFLSLCAAGPAAAAGGGPGGGGGAGAGGAGASSGGGHGGGVSGAPAGAGHMGASSGFHSGLSGQGNAFHSMSPTYNGAPRYLPGGFSPNVSGRLGSARSGSARSASRVAADRPVVATQDAGTYSAQARAAVASRPANTWTDPVASNGVRPASRRLGANLSNRSDNSYRQYIENGNYNGLTTPDGFAGSYLYPGAYGSALNSYYNGQNPRGLLTTNGAARSFAQNRSEDYPYGGNFRYRPNGYYPYFGVFGFPFFGADFGYGYYGNGYGNGNLNGDNTPGNNDQSVATVDSGPAPADQPAAQAGPDTQGQPNATPAQPANPDVKAASGAASNGPDSLIEAVQAELARRGYFAGKVNAMYGPTTREALRRFQTDEGLAATGRINEATLHALELD